jgi:hypothetical protein
MMQKPPETAEGERVERLYRGFDVVIPSMV